MFCPKLPVTFGGGGQDSTEGFLSLVFWTVSIVFDFVLGLLPGAGIAPGGADTFLLSNKKVPKEIDPAAHDPPLSLRASWLSQPTRRAAELPPR